MISSLLQNPAKGGIPAMAIVPIKNSLWVQGIFWLRPPIFRMSCSPESAWMTEPADRNKQGFEEGMGHQMENRGRIGADAARRGTCSRAGSPSNRPGPA